MQKKGIKMKQRIILILLIILEVVISVLICSRINIDKYDSWLETDAVVFDIHVNNGGKGFRSNQSTHTYIWLDYLNKDDKNFIMVVNYRTKLEKGDIITIKYNPDNQNEIIYLPYEKHRMKTEIRNTIIFFAFLVLGTYVVYCMVFKD